VLVYTTVVSDADAITMTVDSLLSRLKLGCDGGYDVVMKGLNVVVVTNWLVQPC
jgi:hypothetical protein